MRTWGELLGDAEPEEDPEQETAGFFGRLRGSLSRSRRGIWQRLSGFDPLDDESWESLEEALIGADVGMAATDVLVERLRARRDLGELDVALAEEIEGLFGEPATLSVDDAPSVVLVVGVNGTGKTTTIGKLAFRLREHERDVVVAAADTFRAAAGEQLEIWAQRAGADYVGSARGGDPAAVAFDAVEATLARGRDVAIVDTAGRLHTQVGLMEELKKVRRVIERRLEGAPHETLLVLDATTGQNGLQQARLFHEAVGVTGVCLTKLDGSAKGGIVLPVAVELGLPVKLIGIGEGVRGLAPLRRGRLRPCPRRARRGLAACTTSARSSESRGRHSRASSRIRDFAAPARLRRLHRRRLGVRDRCRGLRVRPGRPRCRRPARRCSLPLDGARTAARVDPRRPLPTQVGDARLGRPPRCARARRGRRHRRRRPRARGVRAGDRDCARGHVLPPCAGGAAPRAGARCRRAHRRQRRLQHDRERRLLPRPGAGRAPARRRRHPDGLRRERGHVHLVGGVHRPATGAFGHACRRSGRG